MPYTKIETKHTTTGYVKDVPCFFDTLDKYRLQVEDDSTIVNDNVFIYPIKFYYDWPLPGDELNQRNGKKINAKQIRILFKSRIDREFNLGITTYRNPFYYMTKGVNGFFNTPTTTLDTTGSATAQNVSGSTYGTGNNSIHWFSTAGAGQSGDATTTNGAQMSTIQGTTTAQQITATTNVSIPQFISLPGQKLKLNLRVMIVQADPDYFNDDMHLYSPHKALLWFVKNRVWLGQDTEPVYVDAEDQKHYYYLSTISNTDKILRESSDYAGSYKIVYDNVIKHVVGSDVMTSFDIPLNQDITFNNDGNPTNKKAYHILVFPPFTNKSLTGPYQYPRLPAIAAITDNEQDTNVVSWFDTTGKLNHGTDRNEPIGTVGLGDFKIDVNVRFTYLDF